MKRKVLTILILIIFIALTSKKVNAEVTPTKNFYVNDYANILSEETENFIMNNSVALANATTAQIVVVTVESTDGQTIEEYANKLFNKFGIGDAKKNNGLLILVSLNDRQSRIEVGYGLEGLLPDGKCGRYQDEYQIPYYKENNFDEGTVNIYKAFFAEIAKEYNYTTDIIPVGEPLEVVNERYQRETELENMTLAVGTIGIIKAIAMYGVLGTNFKKKKRKTKIITFLILETVTIIITALSYKIWGQMAALGLFTLGTIFNILGILLYFPTASYYGGGRRIPLIRKWRRFFKWRLQWRRWLFWWWWIIKKFLIDIL